MIKGIFDTKQVFADGQELTPDESQKIRNHSPDGFSWGYAGSGPAQLALAILLYFTGDKDLSQRLYQKFKWDIIAVLPSSDFEIDNSIIRNWVNSQVESQ